MHCSRGTRLPTYLPPTYLPPTHYNGGLTYLSTYLLQRLTLQVRAEANATRGLRDQVFARGAADDDGAAVAAANDAALTRQYYTAVLGDSSRTRLLIGEELQPTLLSVLPACGCADGECGDEGWCKVER